MVTQEAVRAFRRTSSLSGCDFPWNVLQTSPLNHFVKVGGGSCFDPTSALLIGNWFHLGRYRSHAIINTAMPVDIGKEVGLGRMTNTYTHGAYLSKIDGFPAKFAPVRIGNRVWIPSATVNPGVVIGDDVVIGAGSLVTRDIPSGCLAMGAPCRVVKENAYPAPVDRDHAVNVARRILTVGEVTHRAFEGTWRIEVDAAPFDLERRLIEGKASKMSERARELLRRHGIRFRVDTVDNAYTPWAQG